MAKKILRLTLDEVLEAAARALIAEGTLEKRNNGYHVRTTVVNGNVRYVEFTLEEED